MKHLLSPHISPIELAKTIRSLKGVSQNDRGFSQIIDSFISDDRKDRIKQILDGTEQEDEFAIFCRLMGTCSMLNRIDQNPLIKSYTAPDYIATFKPTSTLKKIPPGTSIRYRCFVEVKLCQEQKFKISKNDLARRRTYAEHYGLPLVFAIKFKPFEKSGMWLLIEAKELEAKGRKASIADLVDSHSPILFDDYSVLTWPGLHLINYYTSDATGKKPRHNVHGELVETYVVLPGHEPIKIDERDEILVNAVLDSFEQSEVSITTEGPISAVVCSLGGQARFLGDMVYRLNSLATNEDNSKYYDPARIIASIDSAEKPPLLFDRRYVEHALSVLNESYTVLGFGSIGDPEKNYRRVIRLNN